jgi:ComF family protein
VPLHRLRLLKRRYNQAALLAARLGAAGGIAVGPCVLSRVKRTPSQGGLNQAQRRRNVRGAFAVRPGAVDRVAGARIVLIDDVFTTGATAEACARTLKKAGARRVDLLCLARVVKPR